MKSRANIALSVRISRCVGRASRSAWAALRRWTIADSGNAPSYGRVVDVSCPASACWSQSRSKRDRGDTSALPGRDGENLPGAGTVLVQSARADESGAGRLGTTVVEMGASSQDHLVISCYVVHPCARLRMCRREAPSSRRRHRSRWLGPRRRPRRSRPRACPESSARQPADGRGPPPVFAEGRTPR